MQLKASCCKTRKTPRGLKVEIWATTKERLRRKQKRSKRASTKTDTFLCDILYNLGFLILPALKGYCSPALSQPSGGKGHPSHSPLAFTLKVIDLLHLHPFDTYDQERRGRRSSPRFCSENSKDQPRIHTSQGPTIGGKGILTKIFHQEGEKA